MRNKLFTFGVLLVSFLFSGCSFNQFNTSSEKDFEVVEYFSEVNSTKSSVVIKNIPTCLFSVDEIEEGQFESYPAVDYLSELEHKTLKDSNLKVALTTIHYFGGCLENKNKLRFQIIQKTLKEPILEEQENFTVKNYKIEAQARKSIHTLYIPNCEDKAIDKEDYTFEYLGYLHYENVESDSLDTILATTYHFDGCIENGKDLIFDVVQKRIKESQAKGPIDEIISRD